MSTTDTELVLSPIRVAINAWQTLFSAIVAMPLLLVAVALVTGLLDLAATATLFDLMTEMTVSRSVPVIDAPQIIVTLLITVLRVVPGAVLGVAISRFVVLDDRNWTGIVFGRPTLRYFAWMIGFFLAPFVAFLPLALLIMVPALAIPGFIAALVACAFVAIRLSLFFPALAVEAPSASLSTSWHQTRGNFWRIFWSGALALLPWLAIYVALLITGVVALSGARDDEQLPSATIWLSIFLAYVFELTATTLAAAVSAWIYRSLPLPPQASAQAAAP